MALNNYKYNQIKIGYSAFILYFIALAFLLPLSCKNQLKEPSEEIVIIDTTVQNTSTLSKLKNDTILKKFNLIKYDNYLNFGTTLSAWNRYMALMGKNNIISQLGEETDLSGDYWDNVQVQSYTGEFPPQSDISHKISAHFISCNTSYDNNYHKIFVNDVFQSEPVLVGIQHIYQSKKNILSNIFLPTVIIDYLKSYNFNLLAGSDLVNMPFLLPDENRMQRTKEEFIQAVRADASPGINRNDQNLKYISGNVTFSEPEDFKALYASSDLYAILIVKKDNTYHVYRQYPNKTKLLDSNFNFYIQLDLIPKSYIDIDISSFYTQEQKEAYKTKQLIDNALNH